MASVPTLGERLEFSHGLVAALGEPLTLRLGLHPGDLYLNPPQPSDPSGTRPPWWQNRREGDSAAVTLPLPPLFS
jgi:hypothetical protein